VREGLVLDYVIVNSRLIDVNFGDGNKVGVAALRPKCFGLLESVSNAGRNPRGADQPLLVGYEPVGVGLIVSNAPGIMDIGLSDPMTSSYICPWDGGSLTGDGDQPAVQRV